MKTETCVLSDGRRVRYRLDLRKTSKYYYVYFEGLDGKRREITTKETNQKRARDSAVVIIGREYEPKVHFNNISWDDAIKLMVVQMSGRNLRLNTILSYKYAIKTFRNIFPKAPSPASVTTEMAKHYKLTRMATCKPQTVEGYLNELNTVFGKWWMTECVILPMHRFANIEPPKVDKKDPRIIEATERDELLGWLDQTWDH